MVSSIAPNYSPAAQLAQQAAARLQYQRTGIDKDAAAGDPDHDARKSPTTVAGPTVTGTNGTPGGGAATTTSLLSGGGGASSASASPLAAAQTYAARTGK